MAICLSVCPVPDFKSITEGCGKVKIGRKEAMGDPWPHLEIEMSKVKVTMWINAMTENHPHLWKGEGLLTSNLVHRLSTMTLITNVHGDLKSQMPRSPGCLTLCWKMTISSKWGKPTDFKLGVRMEYDGSHHQHEVWPPTWKLWVALQVTTCRGQRHIVAVCYRPYSLFLLHAPLWINTNLFPLSYSHDSGNAASAW